MTSRFIHVLDHIFVYHYMDNNNNNNNNQNILLLFQSDYFLYRRFMAKSILKIANLIPSINFLISFF